VASSLEAREVAHMRPSLITLNVIFAAVNTAFAIFAALSNLSPILVGSHIALAAFALIVAFLVWASTERG
jgi:hypothetical protein